MRTTLRSVKFDNSFRLNGVGSTLPPGTYLIETDEETIAELSLPTYRRICTTITILMEEVHEHGWRVFTIDPQDLEAALSRDVNETEKRTGECF